VPRRQLVGLVLLRHVCFRSNASSPNPWQGGPVYIPVRTYRARFRNDAMGQQRTRHLKQPSPSAVRPLRCTGSHLLPFPLRAYRFQSVSTIANQVSECLSAVWARAGQRRKGKPDVLSSNLSCCCRRRIPLHNLRAYRRRRARRSARGWSPCWRRSCLTWRRISWRGSPRRSVSRRSLSRRSRVSGRRGVSRRSRSKRRSCRWCRLLWRARLLWRRLL
jgi:hypothetical protein